jgi:hypothetical protein
MLSALPTNQRAAVELIEPPRVVDRPLVATVGLRVVTPFRGMLSVRDGLMRELRSWLDHHQVESGPLFMRFHVVDMVGDMEIEVGAIADAKPPRESPIRRGEMPAGRYATLTYVDHALRANRHLIDWAREGGLAFDRRATPVGDAFACRYEVYLSDERIEKRKTRWRVQLNFKLAQ